MTCSVSAESCSASCARRGIVGDRVKAAHVVVDVERLVDDGEEGGRVGASRSAAASISRAARGERAQRSVEQLPAFGQVWQRDQDRVRAPPARPSAPS